MKKLTANILSIIFLNLFAISLPRLFAFNSDTPEIAREISLENSAIISEELEAPNQKDSGLSFQDIIDISGEWYFRLHRAPLQIPAEGYLALPGTLDSNRKGIPEKPGNETSRLSRKFKFEGDVSYFKSIDIPEGWRNKDIYLFLERTRPSILILDGDTLGSIAYISSPHIYNLPNRLTPGSHEIEIIINNLDSIPGSIRKNSNATSEYTQTNWNGIIGDMLLIAIEDSTLNDETVSFHPKSVNPLSFQKSKSSKNKIQNKDEINNSRLYTEGNRFMLNGQPMFLRGTVDSAVFPLTAYPPTDYDYWESYFELLKDYGLNHVRFHSWCPPEAAFKAADDNGFFLMIELPVWGNLDNENPDKISFLENELEGILDSYSHHPSFALFSVGNELWGDITLMRRLMKRVKERNPEILTTLATNLYSGMYPPQDSIDFVVASRIGRDDNRKTDIRGSFSYADIEGGGILNSTYPNTLFDYGAITDSVKMPVISHEVGQYQTYPDYDIIEELTGMLRPENLLEFRQRAEKAGILPRAKRFAESSTLWASRLYEAEIEMLVKSNGIAGYQLMSLMDYPGQGTANVGLLDILMNRKKGISIEKWKEVAGETIILAEFPKFCFSTGEYVEIPIKFIDYSHLPHYKVLIDWNLPFAHGKLETVPEKGINDAGVVRFKTPDIKKPEKFTLTLKCQNPLVEKHYPIWVYPKEINEVKDVYLTSSIDQALDWLTAGRKVILTPEHDSISEASLPPMFTTDFWNYRMFRTICDLMETTPSPGTLGTLISAHHPAFKSFPTDAHTDWQWYAILKNSRPIIIDRLPTDYQPILEPIDNVERNFRLAIIIEWRVGKGKLMVVSTDYQKATQFPEGRWFFHSIEEYVASKDFNPNLSLTPSQVKNLLTKPSNSRLVRELKNEIYDAHWE